MRVKIITPSLGPNVFFRDVLLSLWAMVPFSSSASTIQGLNEQLSKLFNTTAYSFNSGRSALLTLLQSLDLKTDDEVLIQAYTCVAVPDAVLWAGAIPVYVDIDQPTLGIDPKDLEKKITKNSRVVIVQHTLGLPSKIEQILVIAKRNNLIVIEDCAHSLGIFYKGKLLGTFGDAAITSFGRDKMISSVYGGAAIISDEKIRRNFETIYASLPSPSFIWIYQQLTYNLLIYKVTRTYYLFDIGKILHLILRNLNLLSKAVIEKEKKAIKPEYFPCKMPAQLALLALDQLNRLEEFNKKRQLYSELYKAKLNVPKESIIGGLLRFNILVESPQKVLQAVLKKRIYLDSWYTSAIAPNGTDYSSINYKDGNCKVAETVALKTLSLPTNPNLSQSDILEVITSVNNYYDRS